MPHFSRPLREVGLFPLDLTAFEAAAFGFERSRYGDFSPTISQQSLNLCPASQTSLPTNAIIATEGSGKCIPRRCPEIGADYDLSFANCSSFASSVCFLGLHDHRVCHERTRERERQANLDSDHHFHSFDRRAYLLLCSTAAAHRRTWRVRPTPTLLLMRRTAYRQIAQGALSFVFSLDGECNGDGR